MANVPLMRNVPGLGLFETKSRYETLALGGEAGGPGVLNYMGNLFIM